MPPPPSVLLLAGWGRSGSTLVDTILGSVDGVAAVGELRGLWSKLAYGEGSSCGCGRPHRECPFWSEVVQRALGTLEPGAAARLAAAEGRAIRTRPRQLAHIVRSGRGGAAGGRSGREGAAGGRGEGGGVARYGALLGGVYRAIADTAGAGLVVDSSKSPAHVLAVVEHAAVDVRVVQIVRDPRAIAYSWSRRDIETFRFGPASSSVNWLVMNAAVETLLRPRLGDRLRLVRYEDFVSAPRATIAAVCEWAGVDPRGSLPFADERTVRLGANHTVGGNPSRFRTGAIAIDPDDEWAARMPARDALLATLPAAPLMPRYGYALTRS